MPVTPSGYDLWDWQRVHDDLPEAQRHERRTPFEVDKARIIHSAAFRRLQGKTQVLSVGHGDFYRTRLTHTLEVAQLGRGLSQEASGEFRPDPDLVEAICLAHDIGHPPFGHAGERLLNCLMFPAGGFSANAQNLRTLTLLENKHPLGGLNLTRATLDGVIKYLEVHDGRPKFQHHTGFIYADAVPLIEWIKGDRKTLPLEAQIADWVDRVAYCVDDIEDSFLIGILSFTQMEERAAEISELASQNCSAKVPIAAVVNLARRLQQELAVSPATCRDRRRALKDWTSRTMHNDLLASCRIVTRQSTDKSNRYRFALEVPQDSITLAAVLSATAQLLVFEDFRIRIIENKAADVLRDLFTRFCTRDPQNRGSDLLPPDFREMVREVQGDENDEKRIISDFIAGMTEQYVLSYHSWLTSPVAGFPGYL